MHLKNHGGIAAMRDAARDYNTSSPSPVDSPQVLTAARVDPTMASTTPISYYPPTYSPFLPTLWPAFRIIVDESAAPWPSLNPTGRKPFPPWLWRVRVPGSRQSLARLRKPTGNGRLVKLYPRVSSASRRLFFVPYSCV